MRIDEAKALMRDLWAAGLCAPIQLVGAHGIGKSAAVYQAAEEIGMRVVERRASQMPDSGDLIGLPYVEGGVTRYATPSWIAQAIHEGVVLFLDELDRALPDVRQAIFEMADSHKLFGVPLHPDTKIVIATNSGDYNGSEAYGLEPLSPAEQDRYVTILCEADCTTWLAYARAQLWAKSPIVAFLAENCAFLAHDLGKGIAPGRVYPSPRSWERLAKVVPQGTDETKAYRFAVGFVGQEAAIKLAAWIGENRSIPLEDILTGKVFAEKARKEISEWADDISRLAQEKAIREIAYANEEAFSAYLQSMPKEIFSAFFSDCLAVIAEESPSIKSLIEGSLSGSLADALIGGLE